MTERNRREHNSRPLFGKGIIVSTTDNRGRNSFEVVSPLGTNTDCTHQIE